MVSALKVEGLESSKLRDFGYQVYDLEAGLYVTGFELLLSGRF